MPDRYLSQHLQTMFGVSSQTIRNWSGEFEQYLSPGANPGTGRNRTFTEDDLKVMALVSQFKNEGKVYNDIHQAIKQGERGTAPSIPENMLGLATSEQGLAIVNMLESFHKRLSELENKIDNQQNEHLKSELGRLRQEHKESLKEIGKLEALLEIERDKNKSDE